MEFTGLMTKFNEICRSWTQDFWSSALSTSSNQKTVTVLQTQEAQIQHPQQSVWAQPHETQEEHDLVGNKWNWGTGLVLWNVLLKSEMERPRILRCLGVNTEIPVASPIPRPSWKRLEAVIILIHQGSLGSRHGRSPGEVKPRNYGS